MSNNLGAQLLQAYLIKMKTIYASGSATKETSYYAALDQLFNKIGETLKPAVTFIATLRNRGAGLPDGGFFSAEQMYRSEQAQPWIAQLPARGVLEVKGLDEDIKKIAHSPQVQGYCAEYGNVLVTNYRAFVLVGRTSATTSQLLEEFSLAASAQDFWQLNPAECAEQHGIAFFEYIKRILYINVQLQEPTDIAWLLASYAREALARVDYQAQLPSLRLVRSAMEEALGMEFRAEKGEHFFRSTLIQTIFYGVFSAWVLWYTEDPQRSDQFDWRVASYYLHVPIISGLFDQIATPSRLKELGLVKVLESTGAALNRVDRQAFFTKFNTGLAIQYFYEPFLDAFDPNLRKQLGVWYTPHEIVEYMVERVDRALRQELGIEDGLADSNVVVLDPCCGTGAYLVAVLNRIEKTLREQGEEAMIGGMLKTAVQERIFGFELLPAPFVIAHLQLGMLLSQNGGSLNNPNERVGIFLTNALTGWSSPDEQKRQAQQLFLQGWPELQAEHDSATKVKREQKILVILGNPPYNAFAGTSPAEEEGLVEPYKEGLQSEWGIKKFNLDDLYIRFFRLAERRIGEIGKRGIVSFISNYSWTSEPSFVVLRKHLMRKFNKIWIENMHGNRKISEYAPDGRTSETIFAIRKFSPGIRQGIVISLWVKKESNTIDAQILYRNNIDAARAIDRRQQLLESLQDPQFDRHYQLAKPTVENRFSFLPLTISDTYQQWPMIIELCEKGPFNGPIERRGNSLIVLPKHKDKLELLKYYLDPTVSNLEITTSMPRWMRSSGEFKAEETRAKLKGKVSFDQTKIVHYPFKPFDIRLAYLDEQIQPLFSRPSPELLKQATIPGNFYIITRDTADKSPEGVPFLYSANISDYDVLSGHARHIPALIWSDLAENSSQTQLIPPTIKPNLSRMARNYLASLGFDQPEVIPQHATIIWLHCLALGYSSSYLNDHADGIRSHWPRIPLPDRAAVLEQSAAYGGLVAALLNTEQSVSGVTSGSIRAELRSLGALKSQSQQPDYTINAHWGYVTGNGVMPGKGLFTRRNYTSQELALFDEGGQELALAQAEIQNILGHDTYDIALNATTYWQNIPCHVWDYTIGGYQVLKKWLSYREFNLINRPLDPNEVREFSQIVRRIAGLLLLQPQLNRNYVEVIQATWQA